MTRTEREYHRHLDNAATCRRLREQFENGAGPGRDMSLDTYFRLGDEERAETRRARQMEVA